MSLIFPPNNTSSPNLALEASVCCVWIPKAILTPTSPSLSGVESNTELLLQNGRIHCNSEYIIKLITTIQHQIYNAGMGKTLDFETEVKAQLSNHCYYNQVTHDYPDSIEEYVEFIKSVTGEIIGWRIWIIIQDPEYSLDRGLEVWWERVTLYERKAKRKVKKVDDFIPDDLIKQSITMDENINNRYYLKPIKAQPRVFEPAKSKLEYLDFALSPYLNESFCDTLTRNEVLTLNLTEQTNPANSIKALTFDFTSNIILQTCPNVDPVYINRDNYFVPNVPIPPPANNPNLEINEEEEEEIDLVHPNAVPAPDPLNVPHHPPVTFITFPRGSYYVNHDLRHERTFMELCLITEPEAMNHLSEIEQRRLQRMKIYQPSLLSFPGEHMNKAKKNLAQKLIGYSQEQIKQYTLSIEFRDLIESVIHHDDLNTGGKILQQWHQGVTRVNQNWSAVIPDTNLPCSSLSDFGNRMALEGILLEAICGVSVLHVEILTLGLISMSSGDIDPEKLRAHMLFYGPPASGKSFIIDTHAKLRPDGFCNMIGHQTRRANTTDMIRNGINNLMDELPETFTQTGDGTGFADVKLLLSKGIVKTEQPVIVDGQRKMVIVESQNKSQFFACTNCHLSSIPEAIVDRFGCVYVPAQHRYGVDPIVANQQMMNNPDSITKLNWMKERWTRRMFIANLYWTLHRLSPTLMPAINSSIAIQLTPNIFNYLYSTYGIEVQLRDQDRIIQTAVSICLFNAINEVFFTDKYLAPNTPFEYNQIFLLIPHLVITREQLYFTISLFHQTIVDPSLTYIAEAMLEIINERPLNERYASGDVNGSFNYNYYLIAANSSSLGINVIDAVARRIKSRVKTKFDIGLSHEVLIDVLRWMTTQHKEVNQRMANMDDNNPDLFNVTNTQIKLSVASIRCSGTMRFGFEVLVDFLEDIVKAKKQSIVLSSIEQTIDNQCEQSKFITAMNFRYGHPRAPKEYIFPHLFHVLEVKKEDKKPIKIRNPNEKPFGYDFFINQQGNITDEYQEDTYFQTINDDLDTKTKQQWYETHSKPITRENWQDTRKYPQCSITYPTYIIKGELQKHQKNLLPEVNNQPIQVASIHHLVVEGNVHENQEEEEEEEEEDILIFSDDEEKEDE